MLKLPAVVLVAVLAAACGGAAKPSDADQPTPCNGVDSPTAGAPTELPLGLPLTPGATVLRVETQGKTTISYAKVAGDNRRLVAVRDQVLAALRAKGYTASSLDAEPGFEAEAELQGPHHGTLKVTPLCKGVLRIRYKINQ